MTRRLTTIRLVALRLVALLAALPWSAAATAHADQADDAPVVTGLAGGYAVAGASAAGERKPSGRSDRPALDGVALPILFSPPQLFANPASADLAIRHDSLSSRSCACAVLCRFLI